MVRRQKYSGILVLLDATPYQDSPIITSTLAGNGTGLLDNQLI